MGVKIKVEATCGICPKRSTRTAETEQEGIKRLQQEGWLIIHKLRCYCPDCGELVWAQWKLNNITPRQELETGSNSADT
jgi:hypothetical protein